MSSRVKHIARAREVARNAVDLEQLAIDRAAAETVKTVVDMLGMEIVGFQHTGCGSISAGEFLHGTPDACEGCGYACDPRDFLPVYRLHGLED